MTNNDIVLLKAVNEVGSMSTITHYRSIDIAADSRLKSLESNGYIKKHISNDDLTYAGDYEITGMGYAFLTDYETAIQKSNEARKRELASNIYIPLIVTIITNVIVQLLVKLI